MKEQHERVLILDFGSQYTQLIARRIREHRVFCEILPCSMAAPGADLERILTPPPAAVILSGGPASVYAEDAPKVDPRLFEQGVPVLGVCYGLQAMAEALGGRVEASNSREYGMTGVKVLKPAGILAKFSESDSLDVWMSHGDKISVLPAGFEILAISDNTPYCVVADEARKLHGVQFHPEVSHTSRGNDMIAAFLFGVAGVSPTWTPASFVEEAVEKVRQQVGDARAICGLSGGVDSSVAAVICHQALGDRLTCVFVDNGLLRLGEFDYVQSVFREHFGMKLVAVNARDRFLSALAGVTDPESKRKIIGRVFVEVFEEEAKRASDAKFLVQGTIYPDVIESVATNGPASKIKSHHNVGGLPERMHLQLCEPLRALFKDEVRAAGYALGMPKEFIRRQPFPGPGLAIRCLGEVTEPRLTALRQADAILDAEVRSASLYESLWQSFCVLLPVRTVGVMGDERTYDEICAVRAVHSQDGMTASWAKLPHDLLERVSSRIVNEVPGINRVVYDITSKPPSTIEFE
jgi:GMP synthase (glutamine-hydrolysing)